MIDPEFVARSDDYQVNKQACPENFLAVQLFDFLENPVQGEVVTIVVRCGRVAAGEVARVPTRFNRRSGASGIQGKAVRSARA